jgi:hypothetical protein
MRESPAQGPMSEAEPDEGGEPTAPSIEDDAAFHHGTRLTEIKLSQNLSVEFPQLEPLHHIKVEFLFHKMKIGQMWNTSHWLTLAIGCLAVLIGGWDLGVGELSGGGGHSSLGVNPLDPDSGLSNLPLASIILTLFSVVLWVILLARLFTLFPLMRSQAVSLYVALIAAEISQFWAHAGDPKFPFGFDGFSIAICGVGLILVGFVVYILRRAVIDTRDVHVEEKHAHPDPSQMELAKRDHSLFAWGIALGIFGVLALGYAWSGAHYVAVREPGSTGGWWMFKILHYLFGFGAVWAMMHTLWYPQMMLGEGGVRIESDRAREISLDSEDMDAVLLPAKTGTCPSCSADTSVRLMATGEIVAACSVEGCGGSASLGERCPTCNERISTRVVCLSCHTSAPAQDHFAGDDAW